MTEVVIRMNATNQPGRHGSFRHRNRSSFDFSTLEKSTKISTPECHRLTATTQQRKEALESLGYTALYKDDFAWKLVDARWDIIPPDKTKPSASTFQRSSGTKENESGKTFTSEKVIPNGERKEACSLFKGKSSSGEKNLTPKHHQRHFVEHNYHDHSQDVGPTSKSSKPNQYRRRGVKGGVAMKFTCKLHRMLDEIERGKQYEDVVSWQPHGRAFAVHDPNRFVNEVMPKYFLQSKLSSFLRQVNLYGFRRLTRGPDRGAYYHELFLRGKPFLCQGIVRTKVKGTGIKASSSPETEPDFYSMPMLPLESNDSSPRE